jgi:PKD repeat protein
MKIILRFLLFVSAVISIFFFSLTSITQAQSWTNNSTVQIIATATISSVANVFVTASPNATAPLSVAFYGTPTSGYGPLPVVFMETSGNFWLTDTEIYDFGDGSARSTTVNISTVSHTYGMVTVPTNYTVQLIVNNNFQSGTAMRTNYIYVTEPSPNAGFNGTPTVGISPLLVSFTDTSGNLPTSWNWNFGDGGTSTAQNPMYTYTSTIPYYYTVVLIVSNEFGSSTSTKTNYISILPALNFGILPDIKFISNYAENSVFNLLDYENVTTGWVPSVLGTFGNVSVESPIPWVDYLQQKQLGYGFDTINFTSTNDKILSSELKYSTYLLGKLPFVTLYNGMGVENTSINLSQYVTPTTPPNWPAPQIQYTNANDSGTLSATINSNLLTIAASTTLQSPANIFITATLDSTSNNWDEEIVRVYEVLNNYGLFDAASDTVQWVYQNTPTTSVMPTVGYLNTYNGATGILKLSFNSVNQGVKMTLGKSNWLTSSTGQWYTIRMKVMSDTSNNTFSPMLFIYDGVPGNPFDVSVHVLVSVPTTWTWMETAVYCDFTASLYPQLLIRNGNSIGNIYVDAIEIIQAEPGIQLAYGNTRITNADGDWQNASETTGWAFQSAANAALANYFVSGGSLNVSFDGTTTEGIKMTGATGPGITATSSITPGKSAGMKMNLSTSGTMDNPIFLLSVFGTDSQGSQNFNELGASAAVWYVPPSGQLETSYLPMQPYIYGQVQVKNSGNGIFYINNTYLQADMDSPYYWDHSLF